jgi:DNA-directed RNA polymerase alpha subunit
MMSDVKTWAPCQLVIRINTSCQTDEFLAHRVGLIPFRRVGNGTELTVDREGPCTVLARDVVGSAFEPVHGAIEIMTLGDGHRLSFTIVFDEHAASHHARYSACAAVGMIKVDGDGRHRISFRTLDADRSAKQIVLDALEALERRVDASLLTLAKQTPIQSRC